jgi:hypothetical protein
MTYKIAVLDDYQNVARQMADWSHVEKNAQRNAAIDTQAANQLGIEVKYTDYRPDAVIELTH